MSDFLFVHSDVDSAGLSPLQFRLLAHLCRRAGADGLIYSSVPDMAQKCGLQLKTVQKGLRELEARGVIRSDQRPGMTSHRVINPPATWKPHPTQKTTPPKKRPGSQNGMTPHPKYAPTPLPKNGLQSISPEGNPLKAIQTDRGFSEFWKAYPRKEAKGAAERAWAKIKQSMETLPAILNALRRQSKSDKWQEDGGRFIPHPATWLNGKRWLDEPLANGFHLSASQRFHPVPPPISTEVTA